MDELIKNDDLEARDNANNVGRHASKNKSIKHILERLSRNKKYILRIFFYALMFLLILLVIIIIFQFLNARGNMAKAKSIAAATSSVMFSLCTGYSLFPNSHKTRREANLSNKSHKRFSIIVIIFAILVLISFIITNIFNIKILNIIETIEHHVIFSQECKPDPLTTFANGTKGAFVSTMASLGAPIIMTIAKTFCKPDDWWIKFWWLISILLSLAALVFSIIPESPACSRS